MKGNNWTHPLSAPPFLHSSPFCILIALVRRAIGVSGYGNVRTGLVSDRLEGGEVSPVDVPVTVAVKTGTAWVGWEPSPLPGVT